MSSASPARRNVAAAARSELRSRTFEQKVEGVPAARREALSWGSRVQQVLRRKGAREEVTTPGRPAIPAHHPPCRRAGRCALHRVARVLPSVWLGNRLFLSSQA